MKKTRISREYIMVIVLCCLSVTGAIGVANSYSLFYVPMTQIWNVSRVAATLHVTIASTVSGFVTPVIGRLSRKINMRYIFIFGLILYMLSGYGIASTTNVSFVNMLAVVKGVASSCISIVFVTNIINNWFIKSKGKVLGIVLSSSGIGGAVFSPIVQKLMDVFGFRWTFLACLMATLVLCAPFALLCPLKPENVGLKPYGADDTDDGKKSVRTGLNLSFRLDGLYILLLLTAAAVTSLLNVVSQLPSFSLEKGFSADTGALQLSCVMIGNVLFKLLIGVIIDSKGIYVGYSSVMLISIAGIAAIMLNSTNTMLYVLSGILYGAAYSAGTVGVQSNLSHFYDASSFIDAYSISTLVTSLYSSALFTAVNYVYDRTHTYVYSFIILAVLGFVGILFLLTARTVASRRKRPASQI